MDEISQGPKRDFRLPFRRWLAVAAAAALITVGVVLAVTGTGDHRAARLPGSSIAPSASSPSPAAAPGTVLLTCASANWGQLAPGWRALSLQAGPVWLVNGRLLGYAHDGGPPDTSYPVRHRARWEGSDMIVEVASGSVVVMKAAAQAWPYFRFWDGLAPGGGFGLPAGDSGFTFVACPHGDGGPNGQVTDFHLAFSIQAGRAAPVDIWPSSSSAPIRVTFTCPGGQGCQH